MKPKPRSRPGRCLTSRCPDAPEARGLCHACYCAAVRAVAAGTITWATLERRGAARPPRRGRFTKALESGAE